MAKRGIFGGPVWNEGQQASGSIEVVMGIINIEKKKNSSYALNEKTGLKIETCDEKKMP